MNGIERIAVERQRQIEQEGWTAEHDDQHKDGAMAWAAVCYAAPNLVYERRGSSLEGFYFIDPWPWDQEWDKRQYNEAGELLPSDPFNTNRPQRIRQLEKAGALIAAEIDRLLRSEAR